MKIIELKSIGQYIDSIYESDMYKNYIYRGQKNKDYSLTSSLKRNYGTNFLYAEIRLLENFKKYGLTSEYYMNRTIWEDMILAQHHGLPTRLLDFTSSPLVALHFALTDNILKEDAAVWCIDINKIHTDLLPRNYKKILEEHKAYSFTVEMLEEMNLTLKKYNQDMKDKSLIFIEPPSSDIRIVNQNSIFAVLPNALDPLDNFVNSKTVVYKFVIPYDKIISFREQLDSMNITEGTMFPGLDGLSNYLKRRYYYGK